MAKTQGKSTAKRFFNSWFMIAIYLLVFVLIMREVVALWPKLFKTKDIYNEAYIDYKSQESKTKASKLSLDLISSDRGIEGYIRETYPVVKDNEKVIVLFDSKEKLTEPLELPPTTLEKIIEWWNKLYNNVKINSISNTDLNSN